MRAGLTVKRKEKRGQREVYVLETLPGQAPRRTICFDTESGLLSQADQVVFEDYREIDGLKVPCLVKLHGGEFGVTFDETRHDVPIDNARFDRPAPGPSFEKNFAGLKDEKALPVLRRVVGQGVRPSDGRLLYDLIVKNGYKRGLDIGTARGYASLWFGLAMKHNGGKVITIEIDPETADEARQNFRDAGLDGVIDSRINDALMEIPGLKGDFDFVFMDTGAPLNKKFLDLLYSRISPGGAITAHNADSFQSHQPDFLKAIQGDPKLDTEIVKTGSGGISISIKRR